MVDSGFYFNPLSLKKLYNPCPGWGGHSIESLHHLLSLYIKTWSCYVLLKVMFYFPYGLWVNPLVEDI